jgi:hypothetical protein
VKPAVAKPSRTAASVVVFPEPAETVIDYVNSGICFHAE